MPPRFLVAAKSERKLSDSLINQHRGFLEQVYPVWGVHQAESLAEQTAMGALSTLLWKSADGGALGLVWVQHLPAEERVHGVWMDPTGPEALKALLEDIEQDRHSPVTTVTDVLPGLDDEEQPRFFEPKGFWHRAKVVMRRTTPDPVRRSARVPNIRPIDLSDLAAIVGVYARAYSDRPGEFWTWGAAGARAFAETDVMSHRSPTGGWVPSFLPNASYVWEDRGKVVGAVLVEAGRSGIPYVEDLIVEPEFHRRGIGRCLLETAIDQLVRDGSRAVELGAIRLGAPYRLYQKLGFEELPPTAGRLDGHWVRGPSPF